MACHFAVAGGLDGRVVLRGAERAECGVAKVGWGGGVDDTSVEEKGLRAKHDA